ncbi:F0F1 ATP synthase subunit A [Bifidobacterium mongoliense]|jgi:F-type H+-transporting ATPase subunit a|uniref:ATP synthase subunit a n=1 Tax=Bifidobacterium mongoliense TaxID=518643 RepID=A0A423UBP7_9BIFI|nr:F0F1 ATP synthase subunit A [Bifidobacterium mongoliense]ROT86117.1 ATP synthase F0F1 subunit A [Bifidobacterium mongoliense]
MSGFQGAGMLLAAKAGPDLPAMKDFLPPQILFQGTPFAINRIILIRIVATIVLLVVMSVTASRAKLIPGRWQSAVEWLLDFVRTNIVYQVMGEERGKRFVPMMTTLFFTIFIFNLCSVIPGANMAATASITMPLVFALWIFAQYWVAACREQGFFKYLRSELAPAGVPPLLLILIAPIQLIEVLLIRPFSLTVRLFANMVAGHLLVATCLAFTQYYLVDAQNALLAGAGVLWFVGGMVFTLFEMFVAALQAYIFTILGSVYISQSYPELG